MKTAKPKLPGQLSLKMPPPTKTPLAAGKYRLKFSEGRETLLIVPKGIRADRPVPLLVLFHGAYQGAKDVMPFFMDHARRNRFLLMLPQSLRASWDVCVVRGGYGPDVLRLDKALQRLYAHFEIDPEHVAFAGFSDGGSYALSLGMCNGRLVSHALVFSGGFMAQHPKAEQPHIFLTHSPDDDRLNIHACGYRLLHELRQENADVTFHEFAGGHVIHPDMVEKAIRFFMGKTPTS